jgi:hypothetical protein
MARASALLMLQQLAIDIRASIDAAGPASA